MGVNTTSSIDTNTTQDIQVQSTGVQPRVVIVGAGFGGLQASKALATAPVHLTVIDRDNYHLFQPMLYEVATAGLALDDISSPIREILKHQSNTDVLMAEVTGIDMQGRRVLMGDESVPYDYLIVATGASNNYFGHDDLIGFRNRLLVLIQYAWIYFTFQKEASIILTGLPVLPTSTAPSRTKGGKQK